MIDGGVGYHQDLTNVFDRISVVAGVNPVGCYAHATHVAGIIGADGVLADSTLGVIAGAPIISVSVNNVNSIGNDCSVSVVNRDLGEFSTAGLDEQAVREAMNAVKANVMSRGRVGIVNMSLNGPVFPTKLAADMVSLSASTPTYPGAFIVQSAGNQNADACTESYNVATWYDAIMVVGAIDQNGQRVQRLNDVNGFRNEGAQSQPGSNFGSCVQGYAPGNRIKSTWANAPQPGHLPASAAHTEISGTSMAAPHVAGLAQYLAMLNGHTTSEQIAWRVLLHGYPLYTPASPNPGDDVWTYTTGGYFPVASPTVEFLVNQKVNDTVYVYTDEGFSFRYDSAGATSCNATGTLNGGYWFDPVYNIAPRDPGGMYGLSTPGTYQWNLDCVSAQGTHGTASTVVVASTRPAAPSVNWYFNNQDRTDQTEDNWPAFINDEPHTFSFRFSSVNTTYCVLDVFEWNTGEQPQLAYASNNFPTAVDWGSNLSLPVKHYRWQINCNGPGGWTGTHSFTLSVI